MAAVYSARLGVSHGLASPLELVVPADVVWIIRDVDWYCAAPLVEQSVQIWIGSADQYVDWWVTDADTTVVHQWRGRQLFEPGDEMTFLSTQGADVTVSGYVLSLP